MWKKDELPPQTSTPQPEPAHRSDRIATGARSEVATIGRSITIQGEVSGDEDLLIQGRVEGSVDLKQHAVIVGGEGEVKASIVARLVTVEGTVEGNISADEQVVLRSSALVQGDISAPRVVLEDGARFRGGVDMGDLADRAKRTNPTIGAATGARKPGEAPRGGTPEVSTSTATGSTTTGSAAAGDKTKSGTESGVEVAR